MNTKDTKNAKAIQTADNWFSDIGLNDDGDDALKFDVQAKETPVEPVGNEELDAKGKSKKRGLISISALLNGKTNNSETKSESLRTSTESKDTSPKPSKLPVPLSKDRLEGKTLSSEDSEKLNKSDLLKKTLSRPAGIPLPPISKPKNSAVPPKPLPNALGAKPAQVSSSGIPLPPLRKPSLVIPPKSPTLSETSEIMVEVPLNFDDPLALQESLSSAADQSFENIEVSDRDPEDFVNFAQDEEVIVEDDFETLDISQQNTDLITDIEGLTEPIEVFKDVTEPSLEIRKVFESTVAEPSQDVPIPSAFVEDSSDIPFDNEFSFNINLSEIESDELSFDELNSIESRNIETFSNISGEKNSDNFIGEYLVESVNIGEEEIEKIQDQQRSSFGSYDEQFYLCLHSILLRLMDDAELIFLSNALDECVDLSKQLHRLGNMLAFQGLPEHAPLVVYLISLLPISFRSTEIGAPVVLQRDREKEARFTRYCPEILHCLNYFLEEISHKLQKFDISKYKSQLSSIYSALNILPGEPSQNAPLPMNERDCGYGFTTRTRFKLVRLLESQFVDAIHFIESTALFGYRSGYSEARQCLINSRKFCMEYLLTTVVECYRKLCGVLQKLTSKDKPDAKILESFEELAKKLKSLFNEIKLEEPLQVLRGLINRFNLARETVAEGESFEVRWKLFYAEADHAIFPVPNTESATLEILTTLIALSQKYRLETLSEKLQKLAERWTVFPESCFVAFPVFLNNLRATGDRFSENSDISELFCEKLQVIFDRQDLDSPIEKSLFLAHCYEFLMEFQTNIETPSKISYTKLFNLLIDARRLHCHSVTRICEVLSALFDRMPRPLDSTTELKYPDFLIDSLYFCNELLTKCIEGLQTAYQVGKFDVTATTPTLFYRSLLKLYCIEGQPNDPTLLYALHRVQEVSNAIRLVWGTTSTPTSVQYYCDQLHKLLHLTTVLGLNTASHLIIEHLADIPQVAYINTNNASLERQHVRILNAVRDALPAYPLVSAREDVRTFFLRAINACQYLASSHLESEKLSQQLTQVSGILFPIAMSSDSTPVMALAFDLVALSRYKNLHQGLIEEFLYWFLRIAYNICPDWQKHEYQELELLSVARQIPMSLLQKHLGTIGKVYQLLKSHSSSIPIAWEYIQELYDTTQNIMTSPHHAVQLIFENAMRRATYIKRHVDFRSNITELSYSSEKSPLLQCITVYQAFLSILQILVDALVDHAFLGNTPNCTLELNLSFDNNNISATLIHNGDNFTESEIRKTLEQLNLIPAPQDNLLELLIQLKDIYHIYPPATQIAYIFSVISQFNGNLELYSKEGRTYILLQLPAELQKP